MTLAQHWAVFTDSEICKEFIQSWLNNVAIAATNDYDRFLRKRQSGLNNNKIAIGREISIILMISQHVSGSYCDCMPQICFYYYSKLYI